ncbi:MAG: sugar phosphate isomerase/epimerase [Clostridia bacterium]|nr:sugar phosphate isomerase/epimerase [Clostridia bacterium]
MWKQKIGMSVGPFPEIPSAETVRLIAAAGFDAVSPIWREDEDLGEVLAAAEECGLAVQSLHAPYLQAAAMWSADPEVFAPAVEEMMTVAASCVKYRIPVLVVHPWIGFEYDFDEANLCFDHYDALVRYAEENGFAVAFENTEGEEFLFALLERYKENPAVGFCWDSGHELCYNHSQNLLAKYGNRLLMTHLNDNLGISRFDGVTYWTDDLHLLPFDGIADWEDNVCRLKNAAPQEYLNFELTTHSKPDRHENDVYAALPPEVYLAEAYNRACRIAWQYAK